MLTNNTPYKISVAFIAGLLNVVFIFQAQAFTSESSTYDIWPQIAFKRGADLCRYDQAYSQTQSEYMREMTSLASELLQSGAYGDTALNMLVNFDRLYQKNLDLASRYNRLQVTLGATLKSYLDQYYREIRPRIKKLSFNQTGTLLNFVRQSRQGQRPALPSDQEIEKIDFFAHGTYALAPNCQGNIQVTLHLIGRSGETQSFVATGRPATVMSQIASQMFTQFQRTQFPSSVAYNRSTLYLVGGANGSVDRASSPEMAKRSCQSLGARLPRVQELEYLDALGDWSGGVSLEGSVWALPSGKVYAPHLQNPTPVRSRSQVNAKSFSYYCVSNRRVNY